MFLANLVEPEREEGENRVEKLIEELKELDTEEIMLIELRFF